jgi:DNA-binding protein HU-beta
MLDLRAEIIFHLWNFPNLQGGGVNKSELVDHVAKSAALDKRAATSAVDAVLDGVMTTVKSGDKVSLFGFGVFTPTSRAARTGRNPQTGAPVKIAASKSVRFSPGTAFKASLNQKGGARKAAPAKAAKSAKATAKAAKASKAGKSAKKK